MCALGQNEKTAVLRNELQPRGALGLGPAEPAISRAKVQRGAGPAEQGEPAAVGRDRDVAQRFADERGGVEVVVRAQLLIEAGAFVRKNQAQLVGGHAGQSRRQVGISHAPSGARGGTTRQKNRSSICAPNCRHDR